MAKREANKRGTKRQPIKRVRTEDFRIAYSNGCTIINTARDIQFIFGHLLMGTDNQFFVNEHTLVAMSPQHAKSVLFLLEKRVKEWEAANGEITIKDSRAG